MCVIDQPRWLVLLNEQLESKSITAVADEVGYSRTAISLAKAEKYTAGMDKLAARILDVYSDRIMCPHLQSDIAPNQCREFHTAPLPMSDPSELRHWLVCQTCSHNQSCGGEDDA